MQSPRFLEIMDTTLRDGEQVQNVSYTAEEKLTIAKILLMEVKIDRLEVTSAKASEGEYRAVKQIVAWAEEAKLLERLEILSFVDNHRSTQWAKNVGVKRINLLTKGSHKHCVEQLRKTPAQHLAEILDEIQYANSQGLEVNVYLEDFSNGIKHSPDYVHDLIATLLATPVKRILLPDTLGIFNPFEVYEYLSELVTRYPQAHFEFHPHNDYGMATANALAAVKAGVRGIHATVNGMGERAGNVALDEIVVALKDFLDIQLNVQEKMLYKASQYVEMFSGLRMANNKPIYGKNVFIQTAGIHADGDKKGNLYANLLKPERFNRKRGYALGKLSGKASLDLCLRDLDIELSEEEKKILLSKIIEIGDRKGVITTEDLPYLISDIAGNTGDEPFRLLQYAVHAHHDMKSSAALKCAYYDDIEEAAASGDGGYDAFMNALKPILEKFNLPIPQLVDYIVTIPPGGKTDALVQATISWQITDKEGLLRTVTTRGVDSDQNKAAIEATVKMINLNIRKTEQNRIIPLSTARERGAA